MEKEVGYGECPDCIWFRQPLGCNVKRESDLCLLNKKARSTKKTSEIGEKDEDNHKSI